MRLDLEALRAQYGAGLKKAAGNALFNADTALLIAVPVLKLVGVGDETSGRVFTGLETARQQIELLAGEWKRWAEAGQRGNGTSYSFAQWQDQARVVSKDIRDWTDVGAARTAFVAVKQAAGDTVKTVQAGVAAVEGVLDKLPDEEERAELLFWLKVLAGGLAAAAGVVLLGKVATGVKVVRALT